MHQFYADQDERRGRLEHYFNELIPKDQMHYKWCGKIMLNTRMEEMLQEGVETDEEETQETRKERVQRFQRSALALAAEVHQMTTTSLRAAHARVEEEVEEELTEIRTMRKMGWTATLEAADGA